MARQNSMVLSAAVLVLCSLVSLALGCGQVQGPEVEPDDGYRRTVIMMEKVTTFGEDVFFRGGLSHELNPTCTQDAATSQCAVPIRYRDLPLPVKVESYEVWRKNDSFLDWYGSEKEQGVFNGKAAQGSPAVWTSSNGNSTLHHPLNTFGDHYWVMDVDMDCTRTQNGTIQVKGYMNGWETGINHVAECGKLNVLYWQQSFAMISDLPK